MNEVVNLSYRLGAIKKMVGKSDVIYDIGTDHALLPISMLIDKQVKKAYACDIGRGPLIKAEENIKKYRDYINEDDISTILSDGFQNINIDKNIDCVIIAGMGGELITQIISDSGQKIKKVNKLILSPHTFHENVRICVEKCGMMIVDEEALYDDNKYYVIIKCLQKDDKGFFIKDVSDKLEQDVYYEYGYFNINKKNNATKEYIMRNINVYNKILNAVDDLDDERAIKRRKEIENKMNIAKKAVLLMESKDVC